MIYVLGELGREEGGRGWRNWGSYPEGSGCSLGHDFGGGQTSEREEEEIGDIGLDLRVEECMDEARN